MSKTPISAFLAVFSSLTLASADAPKVSLERLHADVKVKRPITLLVEPGTQRELVVSQRGTIQILPQNAGEAATTFLDFTKRSLAYNKESEFEEGLVGMAFHPKYSENRKFYIAYTLQEPKRYVLSEMQTSSADKDKADPATERILLEIPLPYWNHHSGNMFFGQDGLFYFTLGDGGLANDPHGHGQNTFTLLGKMLRINVDTKTGALPYGIPEDNPFNQKPGHRAEIYALGLRNPWGISQDAKGNIWLADVGQNLWEEVNLIEKGGNYGWSIKEASVNFPAYAGVLKEAPTKLLEPIHQYSRQDGISITGGLVYRGKQIPALQGAYVYGDWGSGKVWALRYDFEAKKITSNDLILQLPPDDPLAPKPTAFVEDAAQEIIILDWGGKLLKIVPKA